MTELATSPTSLPDSLSVVLQSISLQSGNVTEVSIQASRRVAATNGLMAFYAVRDGVCRLMHGHHSPAAILTSGEFVFLPHGDTHELRPDEPSTPNLAGPECRVLCGQFVSASTMPSRLVQALPPVIHWNRPSEGLHAILDVIAEEQHQQRPGTQAVVHRLVETLFLQSIQYHLLETKGPSATWLAATLDSPIAPAIAAIHAHPELPWTVNSLARRVHMSRSAFSERFRADTGQSPLRFLTAFRMERAVELLRESKLGVKQISVMVGYDSAAAFSNAFKRWTGAGPAAFRRTGVAP